MHFQNEPLCTIMSKLACGVLKCFVSVTENEITNSTLFVDIIEGRQ